MSVSNTSPTTPYKNNEHGGFQPDISPEPISHPNLSQNLDELDQFKSELLHNYPELIVEGVLNSLPIQFLRGEIAFSKMQKNIVRLSCRYFFQVQQCQDQHQDLSKPAQRLLTQYINRLGIAVFKIISKISEEDILFLGQKICQFADITEEILQKVDEGYILRLIKEEIYLPSSFFSEMIPVPPAEFFIQKAEETFAFEKSIRQDLETLPYQELKDAYDTLEAKILTLPSSVQQELLIDLAKQTQHLDKLIPRIPKETIRKQADLFFASREGELWAKKQEHIESYGKTINSVFLLKSLQSHFQAESSEETPYVAVFKNGSIVGSMEALVWDAAQIFHIEQSLVPTKTKQLQDMFGSIQPYQHALLGSEYLKKYADDLEAACFEKLPLRNFVYGILPGILFGNRDLHQSNYFFQEDANKNLSILVFDNELSFPSNNYVIKWIKEETWLPFRCCLLDFPHADQPLEDDLKEEIQKLVASWDKSFIDFQNYLKSPLGLSRLQNLPARKLSNRQLNALKERIEGFQEVVNKEKFTIRDIVDKLYPCYHFYYSLSYRLYPYHTADWVGYFSCESLCRQAIDKGILSEEKAEKFTHQMQKLTEIPY